MACLVSRVGRELQRFDNLCIPYRFKNDSDGVEVLLISSQKGMGKGLMFPKGGWELDESIEEAALRESIEEAGVLGNVECELGKWNFLSKSNHTFYEGYMFPLFVKEQLDFWPEKYVRTRIWMNVDEAREACRHWWMKEALDIFIERLASSSEQFWNGQSL
ncbi:hypothetical protein ACFE04_031114 [Oxalis oulophora]